MKWQFDFQIRTRAAEMETLWPLDPGVPVPYMAELWPNTRCGYQLYRG